MLLKRFYDDGLAQASYLVACQATGTAIVVDPNLEVDQYVTAAHAEGLRITDVTETHIHADFVSGSRALAAKTGAQLLLSGEGGTDWQYAFADEPHVRVLHDGDIVSIGNIRLQVRHTPGHTPEHIVFVITDGAATERPMGVLTGDFIFVGDVGRPDLLEKAAGVAGTMESSARSLFASLQSFKTLPDYLQLWPGHGAGSACGKSLGAVPSTTLGYERIANVALGIEDESEFVRMILDGQPEAPRYFATMKRVNRDSQPATPVTTMPRLMTNAELVPLLTERAQIIDTRPAAAYATRHARRTISIPFNRSFSSWAGSLTSYENPFYLIADAAQLDDIVHALRLIGLGDIAGYFPPGALDVLDVHHSPDQPESGARELMSTRQMSVSQLATARKNNSIQLLDVRAPSEWNAGHIAGALNIPLASLAERIGELSPLAPLAVQCQSGGRSAIAASILQAHGFTDVSNVTGGFSAWRSEGLHVEHGHVAH